MHPAIPKLAKWCKRFGGSLVLLDNTDDFNRLFHDPDPFVFDRKTGQFKVIPEPVKKRHLGYHKAPATQWHGIHVQTKTVYAVHIESSPKLHANAGAIIHEMGHLFADTNPNPEKSDELAWLGWEITLARLTSCYIVWDAQMTAYYLGDISMYIGGERSEEEWGMLYRDEKLKLARERISHGKRNGIISRRGIPKAVVRS